MLHAGLLGQPHDLAHRVPQRREEHALDARQRGRQRLDAAEVALDDLHAGGQRGPLWVVGQRADVGARRQQKIDDKPPDIPGRTSHQNGHRLPP